MIHDLRMHTETKVMTRVEEEAEAKALLDWWFSGVEAAGQGGWVPTHDGFCHGVISVTGCFWAPFELGTLNYFLLNLNLNNDLAVCAAYLS